MKTTDKYKHDWQEQLAKCIRCGTCRSVCPVFAVTGNENSTARGKVRLIEAVTEGDLELTHQMQQRMSQCLMCKACFTGCPSSVKTDWLFLDARKALAEENSVPFMKKLAFTSLTYRWLFEKALGAGTLLQRLVLKDSPDGRGMVSRIPLPAAGLNARRIIPPLATKPLRSNPLVLKPRGPRRARVAFFTGCMLNYVYPDAGKAIVDILVHNGIEVTLPIDQYCCGTPAFTSGDFTVGRYLAERNIEALSKQPLDAIITGCPSCGLALKHEYGHIIDDPRLKEKWTEIATKVHDITQFLVKIGHREDFHEVKLKLTYHDPCHLVRGMGVSQEPRQMLKAIPGIDFVEMAHADECCGAGGTFSLSYYDISRQINDKKLDAAQDTNAQVLVTGCSVCRMHIDDGLSRRQGTIKVRHTAEILAVAYRIPGKEVIS